MRWYLFSCAFLANLLAVYMAGHSTSVLAAGAASGLCIGWTAFSVLTIFEEARLGTTFTILNGAAFFYSSAVMGRVLS